MLNESALVLEGVTLAQVVELVVEVLVDLARGTVADEQTTEDTHAAHPEEVAVERSHQISMNVPNHRCPGGSGKFRAYLGIRASLVPLRLPRPR